MFVRFLASLDCEPHLNIGYLSLCDAFAYQHVSRLIGNAEENGMRKESLVDKAQPRKGWTLSILFGKAKK